MNIILFICLFIAIIALLIVIRRNRKITRDVNDFIEAVQYRDFTRKYPENNLRKNRFYYGINAITNTFRTLESEKEAQQQYLKRMLELVDTGILAYNVETMDVLLMNEALVNMFNIPRIKNIRWVQKKHENLYNELIEIPLGASRLVSITIANQSIKTLTNASAFQTEGKTYKLIAFHNIGATLEEVESSAWKGLLSVMTHEIMNSIAPVSSLADTMKKRIESLKEKMSKPSSSFLLSQEYSVNSEEITQQVQYDKHDVRSDFADIEFAMETIHRRSESLLRFADTYRSLSKTIVLDTQPVNLYELLNAVYQLMFPSLKQKGISPEIQTGNPEISANIDRGMIEQVVINFITNAAHAVREKPDARIVLVSGITLENEAYITVADNGCGISPENRDKIFIPFFSTKKNGSGIGLSLSREIVKLHNAKLQIQSKAGEGSAFTILFSR